MYVNAEYCVLLGLPIKFLVDTRDTMESIWEYSYCFSKYSPSHSLESIDIASNVPEPPLHVPFEDSIRSWALSCQTSNLAFHSLNSWDLHIWEMVHNSNPVEKRPQFDRTIDTESNSVLSECFEPIFLCEPMCLYWLKKVQGKLSFGQIRGFGIESPA